MQANGLQRRQDHALQLALSCGFPRGTTLIIWPGTIERGFRPATGKVKLFGAKIRFPNGVVFENDLCGAIALAESDGHNINLEQYYLQLNAGEEAVRTANDIGLPGGFAVKRNTNDDGVIVSVSIYTSKGDGPFTNYHHLASLGIDTTTIRCPYWLEKRQCAVDNHFPDEGWAMAAYQTASRNKIIYAPNGDEYRSILNAWIAASVIRPPDDLLGVVRGFMDIVRNLNGSITQNILADLVGVSKFSFSRFLNGVTSSPHNIYKINSLFGIHNSTNTNILRDAAFEAGVDDITAYDGRMTVIMDSLVSRVVVPPAPYRRAEEPTNEFAGLVNVRFVGANDQDPPQIQAEQHPLPIPQVEVDAEEGPFNFAEV